MSERAFLCRDIRGDVHIVDESALIGRHAVYGVIEQDNQVLLVSDRTSDKRWDLPGGGIEAGEEHIDALKREIREETGLTLSGTPVKICEFIEYFFDVDTMQGWESHRTFYSVTTTGTPQMYGNEDDIVDVRLFPLPLDETANIAPVTRQIVAMAYPMAHTLN